LEKAMVEELGNSLSRQPELRVQLLFDYLRGTRGGKESTLELLGGKKMTGLDVS
jgi:hypothetical protein